MRHIDQDRMQDVIGELEAARDAGVVIAPENAAAALNVFDIYESRENTVLGMLMARRPHDEIRDALLDRAEDGDGGG